MFELVAIGPQGGDRWTRPLEPGKVVRLGRAPNDGWAVPWDMRISREHCDVELKNDRLYVRCLDDARNPVYRMGEIADEFTLFPGETFRIGLTTFRLNAASTDEWTDQRDYDFEMDRAAPAVDMVETDRVDGEVEQLRDEIASLRAQVQADALAKRKAAEQSQAAREEARMLRKQLDQLKEELLAAQVEVDRLQSETEGDVSDSKEFQELRADVDKLKEKVRSGEFLALSNDSNRDSDNAADSVDEQPEKDASSNSQEASGSAETAEVPQNLEALRAKLAAEAKQRANRRG